MLFTSVEWQRKNSTAMKFLGFCPNWLLIQPSMTLNLRNTTRHFLQKIIFIKWKTDIPKYAKKVDTNLTSLKCLAYVFSGDSWLIGQTLLLKFERRCNVNRAPVIMVNLKLNWLSWCESGESSACSALFHFVWNWYFKAKIFVLCPTLVTRRRNILFQLLEQFSLSIWLCSYNCAAVSTIFTQNGMLFSVALRCNYGAHDATRMPISNNSTTFYTVFIFFKCSTNWAIDKFWVSCAILDSSLASVLFYARISKVESVLWELCMESARQSNRESWLDICACYAT